jgi:alcohol oxidase
MPSYRGEVPAGHPCFPEGSDAVCGETCGPVDLNAPDIIIIYTAEDDEAIDKFHRDHGEPSLSSSVLRCVQLEFW